MYEILLHDQVVKFYNKLDDKNAARINRAIETLLENETQSLFIFQNRNYLFFPDIRLSGSEFFVYLQY